MKHPTSFMAMLERLPRAALLLIVFALPTYFSPLTLNGFEAQKATLLQVLVAVAALAWLVANVHRLRLPRSILHLNFVVGATLILFVWYCLATVFSIDPGLSLWGSLARQQGLETHASYVIVFLLASQEFTSSVHRWHVIEVALFGSLPVLAYGLLQSVGIDPIPAAGDPNTLYWPVRSTMGQHVFLGSYLAMMVPLAIVRALASGAQTARDELVQGARGRLIVLLGAPLLCCVSFPLVLMAVQILPGASAALLPVIGLYFLMARLFLQQLHSETPRTQRGWYTLVCLVQAGALIATGARGAWLGSLAGIATVGLLMVFRHGDRRIWAPRVALAAAGVAFLVALNLPGGPLQALRSVSGLHRIANITDSGGGAGSAHGRLLIWQGIGNLLGSTPAVGNTWGGWPRLFVGYGPETLHWAFQAVFPLELRRVTSEIWTWDRAHNIFLDTAVDAGIIGLAVMAGLYIVVVYRSVRGSTHRDGAQAFIGIAVAGSVVAHIVDGFFGLETAVTGVLLWLLFSFSVPPAVDSEDRRVAADIDRSSVSRGTIVIACACVLGFGIAGALAPDDLPLLQASIWLAGVAATLLVVVRAIVVVNTELQTRTDRVLGPLVAGAVVSVCVLGGFLNIQSASFAERAAVNDLARNDIFGAVNLLQQSVQHNQHEPQFETELGGALLSMAAQRLNDQGPVAGTSLSDAQHVGPDILGQLSRQQLLQLSHAALSQSEVLSPLDPDAVANMGNLALQASDTAGALAAFQRAETLSHDNPRYFDDEALALMAAGNLNGAAIRVQHAYSLDPTFWYTYYTRGLVATKQGVPDKARADAKLALYWLKNYWPPPPQSQVQQLRSMAAGV